MELPDIVGQHLLCPVIAVLDDAFDLGIDQLSGLIRNLTLLVHRIAKEHLLIGLGILQRHKCVGHAPARSEEHTSELQSLMRISYAVFCLNKKKRKKKN